MRYPTIVSAACPPPWGTAFFYLSLSLICFANLNLFRLLQNLIHLEISHNLLVFLPSELGELLYCLKELKLAGNPLSEPLPQYALLCTLRDMLTWGAL